MTSITLIKLGSLSYLRDDCYKQAVLIFKSHGDSNQCTPYRGNPTNVPHTSHAQSTYGPRVYVSHTVNIEQPSIRKHCAKNEYFPLHIQFTTIYLL
jgi:hypothetical protein